MGGAPTPKWDPIGFDPQPNDSSWFAAASLAHVHARTRVRAPFGVLSPTPPCQVLPDLMWEHGQTPDLKSLVLESHMGS